MHRVVKAGHVLFVTAALVSSAAVSFAQGEMSVMQGTISDEAGGAPLAEATIEITDNSRGRHFTIKADKNGKYYKRGIPYGDYQMVVAKQGYQPINDKLSLKAGVEFRFDFKLAKAAPEGAKEFAEAFAAFQKGDNEAAIKGFEAALVKAPNLPEVRVNLALAYLRAGRKADAVSQLEQAAALAPDEARIQFQLGAAYVEMNDLDKAIGALEKGLAKQPDLATNNLAYESTITLGAVYFAKGDADKSIATFEKAQAAKPGPVVTLGLAKAWLSKGDAPKALSLFQDVVAKAPGTPEAAQAEAFIAELSKNKPSGS